MVPSRDELIEALLVAPAGAALVHRLAERQPIDPPEWDAESVLALAVATAEQVGPWCPDAPDRLTEALRAAPARRHLAELVVDVLGSRLCAPVDRDRQEWWTSDQEVPDPPPWTQDDPFLPSSAWNTWPPKALWSVGPTPPAAADALISRWELFPGPISRWRLRIDPDARVYEVHRPEDWAALVARYPSARAQRPNSSWEIPGVNQRGDDVAALAALPGQRAVRLRMRRFVEPDWEAVAADWDGVHLSWGGFLTCEGTIVDLGDGDVCMLREWGSEQSAWFRQVVSEPEPMPAPDLTGACSGILGLDPRRDEARRRRDEAVLRWRLSILRPPR